MSKKQDVCPHCRVSLQGQAIPREYLEKGYYGKWDGKPQYYSRKIGIEVMGAYDVHVIVTGKQIGRAHV